MNKEFELYNNVDQAIFNYDRFIYPYNRDTIKKARHIKNTNYLDSFTSKIICASVYTAFTPPENSEKKSSYDTAGIICIYNSLIAYSHKGVFSCTQDKIDLENVSTITIFKGNGLFKSIFDGKGSIDIYYENNNKKVSFTINSKDIPYVVGRIAGAIMYENFPYILVNSQEYVTSFIRKPDYKKSIEKWYKENVY